MKFLHSHLISTAMQRKVISCPVPRIFNYQHLFDVVYKTERIQGKLCRVLKLNSSVEPLPVFIGTMNAHKCVFTFHTLKFKEGQRLFALSQVQNTKLQNKLKGTSSFDQIEFPTIGFESPVLMSIEYLTTPFSDQEGMEFFLVSKKSDKKFMSYHTLLKVSKAADSINVLTSEQSARLTKGLMAYSKTNSLYSELTLKTRNGDTVLLPLPLNEAVSVMRGWAYLGQENLDDYACQIYKGNLPSGLYLAKEDESLSWQESKVSVREIKSRLQVELENKDLREALARIIRQGLPKDFEDERAQLLSDMDEIKKCLLESQKAKDKLDKLLQMRDAERASYGVEKHSLLSKISELKILLSDALLKAKIHKVTKEKVRDDSRRSLKSMKDRMSTVAAERDQKNDSSSVFVDVLVEHQEQVQILAGYLKILFEKVIGLNADEFKPSLSTGELETSLDSLSYDSITGSLTLIQINDFLKKIVKDLSIFGVPLHSDALDSRVAELDLQLQASQVAGRASKEEIAELQKALAELRIAKGEADASLAVATATQAELSLAVEKAGAEKVALEEALAAAEARLAELDAVKAAKGEAEADKARLEKKLAEAEARLAELDAAKAAKGEAGADKARLEKKLAEAEARLSELDAAKAAKGEAGADKARLEKKLAEAEARLAELDAAKAAKGEAVADKARLEKKLAEAEARLAELDAVKAAKGEAERAFTKKEAELETLNTALERQIAELEAKNMGLSEQLQTATETHTLELDFANQRIKNYIAELAELQKHIIKIEQELKIHRMDSQRADGGFEFSDELRECLGENMRLKTRLEEMQFQTEEFLSDMKGENARLQSEVIELEVEKFSLIEQMEQLDTVALRLERERNANQEKLDDNTAIIEDLKSRLANSEQMITGLKAELKEFQEFQEDVEPSAIRRGRKLPAVPVGVATPNALPNLEVEILTKKLAKMSARRADEVRKRSEDADTWYSEFTNTLKQTRSELQNVHQTRERYLNDEIEQYEERVRVLSDELDSLRLDFDELNYKCAGLINLVKGLSSNPLLSKEKGGILNKLRELKVDPGGFKDADVVSKQRVNLFNKRSSASMDGPSCPSPRLSKRAVSTPAQRTMGLQSRGVYTGTPRSMFLFARHGRLNGDGGLNRKLVAELGSPVQLSSELPSTPSVIRRRFTQPGLVISPSLGKEGSPQKLKRRLQTQRYSIKGSSQTQLPLIKGVSCKRSLSPDSKSPTLLKKRSSDRDYKTTPSPGFWAKTCGSISSPTLSPRSPSLSPRFDGSLTRFDGSSPRFDGSSPRFDGSSPRFDGSSPRFDGSHTGFLLVTSMSPTDRRSEEKRVSSLKNSRPSRLVAGKKGDSGVGNSFGHDNSKLFGV